MPTPPEPAQGSAALSPFGKARSTIAGTPLSAEELGRMDAFWRACNYLALGMIYLRENPLLRRPLAPEHVKNRLLGHRRAGPARARLPRGRVLGGLPGQGARRGGAADLLQGVLLPRRHRQPLHAGD